MMVENYIHTHTYTHSIPNLATFASCNTIGLFPHIQIKYLLNSPLSQFIPLLRFIIKIHYARLPRLHLPHLAHSCWVCDDNDRPAMMMMMLIVAVFSHNRRFSEIQLYSNFTFCEYTFFLCSQMTTICCSHTFAHLTYIHTYTHTLNDMHCTHISSVVVDDFCCHKELRLHHNTYINCASSSSCCWFWSFCINHHHLTLSTHT